MSTINNKKFQGAWLLSLMATVTVASAADLPVVLSPEEVANVFQNPVAPLNKRSKPASQMGDSRITRLEYRKKARLAGQPLAMPKLGPGEKGTSKDNENNDNTHVADNDMGSTSAGACIFNDDPIAPIEFNIDMPKGTKGPTGELRMDVYDIDAADGEVDKVYVNNQYIGTLNGSNDEWRVNYFTIPPGNLVEGRNLIRIDIDTANPGEGYWCLNVDWGILKVAASVNTIDISRCWVAPSRQNDNNYVNFYAELTNKVDSVKAYIAGQTIDLTDPAGNNVWSGSWLIPANIPDASFPIPFYMTAIKKGQVQSVCPTLKVTNKDK